MFKDHPIRETRSFLQMQRGQLPENRPHGTDQFPVGLYTFECVAVWSVTTPGFICVSYGATHLDDMLWYDIFWTINFFVFRIIYFLLYTCVYNIWQDASWDTWAVFKCKEVTSLLTQSTWDRSVCKGFVQTLLRMCLFRSVCVCWRRWGIR